MLRFLSIFLLCSGGLAQSADPTDRYWNQNRGRASGDSFVDVAPVLSEPEELWRFDAGELASDPVVWTDTVYVVTRKKTQLALVGVNLETGERTNRMNLGSGEGSHHVVTMTGWVGVVHDGTLSVYREKKGKLKRKERIKVDNEGPPCLDRGVLYLTAKNRMLAVALERGERLGSVRSGYGRPAAAGGRVATVLSGTRRGLRGQYSQLVLVNAAQATDEEWKPVARNVVGGHLGGRLDDDHFVLAFSPTDGAAASAVSWYARCDRRLTTRDGNGELAAQLYGASVEGMLSDIVGTPVSWDGRLLGYDRKGALVLQLEDGRYRTALGTGKPPRGARSGPVTRARGVAYSVNFAFDVRNGRLLWCMPDLDNRGALIPLADERLLYVAESGELVALGAGSVAEVARSGPEESLPRGPIAAPEDGPGVILTDGRVVLGAVEARGESVIVSPAAGDPAQFSRAEIALAMREEEAELSGTEYAVFLAWRARLEQEMRERLLEHFDQYRRGRFVAECRRLLTELRAYGLAPVEHGELTDSIGGIRENTAGNADARREKLREAEDEAREAIATRYLAAADWSADRALHGAASLLLGDREERGFGDADVDRLRTWMPAAFPWRLDVDAAERWKEWARELVPADARFLPADHPALHDSDEAWREDAVGLRTPNLLIVSSVEDPAVLGLCLRNGEGAVRALLELFPDARSGEQAAEPMEVHLFETRAAYVHALGPMRARAMEWSAGSYSPDERLSRFFQPDPSQAYDEERDLHRVLAHELTHQFLAERGLEGDRSGSRTPGYWVVEGFARYLEDQSIALGAKERGLSDPRARSIDVCAGLLEQDALMPLDFLLDLSYAEFHGLDGERVIEVPLRFSAGRAVLSHRSIFYDQSGALSFFLLNRAGPDHRSAFLDYLRAVYAGQMDDEGWQLLGYEDLAELEEAFHAFLGAL